MFLKNLWFFLALFLLLIAGFFSQYSVSSSDNLSTFNKHLFFFIFCVPISAAVIYTPLNKIINFNVWIYLVNLVVLFSVLLIGKTKMGATRWLNFGGVAFQPSEFVKISIILMIAHYFAKTNIMSSRRLTYFFGPIIYCALPVVLIVLQPNLGTSMIITLISVSMIMMIFDRLKIVAMLLSILLSSTPLIWKVGLHDYQKKRIMTFLHPEKDSSGAGYNIIQSKIAIGSGGLFGKGYLNGTQSKLQFLPEQHNDFVFSVFGEEFGFFLSIFLILTYSILLFQIVKIAMNTVNLTHKSVLLGCNSMIFWHVIVNTYMCMDLIPVVGVPLPFLSYGRSFFLSNIVCVSLVINVMRSEYLLDKQR